MHYYSIINYMSEPVYTENMLEKLLHELKTDPLEMHNLILTKDEFTTTQISAVLSKLYE